MAFFEPKSFDLAKLRTSEVEGAVFAEVKKHSKGYMALLRSSLYKSMGNAPFCAGNIEEFEKILSDYPFYEYVKDKYELLEFQRKITEHDIEFLTPDLKGNNKVVRMPTAYNR